MRGDRGRRWNAAGARSVWGWGLAADEPTDEQRRKLAGSLARRYGIEPRVEQAVPVEEAELRAPRLAVPATLAAVCTTERAERARHAYGMAYTDRLRAFRGMFDAPPDAVAYPADDGELAAVLDWCDGAGHVVVPFGGGSSVVWGVNPPAEAAGVVTVDLTAMDRVLEIDHVSRAARIQAGALGPAVEDQLRPHGLTLRHFPQSFEWSTVGGWIATRSGGHYATNHTHIDDFVESVRMLTPAGWWESRRLPGSGAGPSPDRLVLGSEGTLGIVTEAWLRLQRRPEFRATAGVVFPSWEAGWRGVQAIAQAKLWPANLRILDPVEAERGAGLDGRRALVIVGFESADVSQRANVAAAVALAREHGGEVDDDQVRVTDGAAPSGRGGAVGAWRDSFVGFDINTATGLGLVADTFETAVTWDRWPDFDAAVRAAMGRALEEVCGVGLLSCRFTHVYPDGPAPYYTFAGMGSQGAEERQWAELKAAASEAVVAAGGTITHHHAVGRMHRPGYDRQRPDLFAAALRAAKRTLDPRGLLNPGVLID
ncbi:MAG TPA: FAD-binding oxidoreductase [Acidimicrobiales bacterium]|nr:FAD-binding oxidoreductase [Acidimicrobiales bacterium]